MAKIQRSIASGGRGTRVVGWLAAAAVGAGGVAARAQCQSGWLDTPDIPSSGYGTNGLVKAVVSWDPDGAGAAQPVLVVAGQFTTVGVTTAANNIAVWNGANWQAMSTGLTGTSAIVYSLAVFNNELVACGTFTNAGGVGVSNIARWNGFSWAALGSGLTGTGTIVGRAMTVFSGQLHVTGSFSTAGGVAAPSNARWNGGSWAGLPSGGPSGYAMTVYNNELYVGGNGSFNQSLLLYRFNGTSWFTTPSGLVGTIDANDNFPFIRALTVHNNKLIVGGNFQNAGPFPNCNGIASWDGSANTWGMLSTGMDEPVMSLTTVGGTLYAGGNFTTAGVVLCFRVARWNGSNWNGPSTTMAGGSLTVQALGAHNGELFAGGSFTSVNGVPVGNLGRYLPGSGQWAPVSNAAPVRAMMGSLVLGGDFQVDVGGGEIARRCLGTNGSAMSAFSDLGGFTGPTGPVYALGTYSNNPFVIPFTVFGGSFTSAGGLTANNIATWRLSTWGTMGSGFNGTVRALVTYNGSFYAAGDFTQSGAIVCSRIAKYVSGAWQPVGGGFNGSVNALYVLNGWLYAGGNFTTAGGNPINYLAAFNGGAWQSVGDGLFANGTGSGVYCMTSYSGDAQGPYLVVGGKFITNFSSAQNLARLGSIVAFFQGFGSTVNDTVRAAAIYEGDLIVGGDFTSTPGGPMNRIARYDLGGAGWQALGSGVDSTVYCLRTVWDTELHVGGAFSTAGGLPSAHWARWNTTGRPAIIQHPSTQSATGCDVTFSVTPHGGYPGLTLQWRRDGVDLANGVGATGAVISGATTASLTMTSLSVADEGAYSCVVSNACGSMTSSSASLDVCGADYNCDGFIDGIDYDLFNNDFENPDPDSLLRADYNRDGFVDGIDYDLFNNDFANGC